jgi:hypothetical protein
LSGDINGRLDWAAAVRPLPVIINTAISSKVRNLFDIIIIISVI